MTKPILIVEDDELQRDMLTRLVSRRLGYGAMTAENGKDALDTLHHDSARGDIKLVLMDIHMPVMDGLEALDIIKQRQPHLPVVMLTGSKDSELAVRAMKSGALDYLNKPYEAERIETVIRNALKIATLSREVKRLTSDKIGRFGFDHLIGAEHGLSHTVRFARRAAESDIPVLITGETGVGKEVMAKAIHGESARAGGKFIALNCGAIPQQLVESTLFGHEKGAFTGATEAAIGKFREADGGTIFLDEIGELPLDSQVKLLRVLQQKEVEPVGASKAVPINVRILSATNRDLKTEAAQGRFREDLYFRLNVLEIALPALKDRADDVILLADHFIERYAAQHDVLPKTLSQQAQKGLQHYAWPGNVRELENVINRAMVMTDAVVLNADDFALDHGEQAGPSLDSAHQKTGFSAFQGDGTLKTMDDIEKEAMRYALDSCGYNVTKASEMLGIAKSTFYRKAKEHGLSIRT